MAARMNKLFLGTIASVMTLGAACGTTIVDTTGSGTTSTGSGTSSGQGGSPCFDQCPTGPDASVGPGTSVASSSTGFGTGGVSATSGTGMGTGGASPVACPSSEPTENASCAGYPDGYRCTYGDSVQPQCRESATCQGGEWVPAAVLCPAPLPGGCPAGEPKSNVTCGSEQAECVYGDDICACGCNGGIACIAPYEWSCSTTPPAPCPSLAPNSGTVCPSADEGASCTYGNPCGDGALVACTGGLWTWQGVECAGLVQGP